MRSAGDTTLSTIVTRMMSHRIPGRWRGAALAAAIAAGSAPVHAQLRGLPSLPSLPGAATLPSQALPPVTRNVPTVNDLVRVRQQRIGEMLRRRGDLVETDAAGEPAVRGQLLVTSPSAALLAAARAEGYAVVRERRLEALDLSITTLRAPAGWDTQRALQRLRELDPGANVDLDHLYLDSGETGLPRQGVAAAAAPAAGGAPVKVGLIDAGVETAHPLLRHASITAWGCGGRKVASAHGTAVASLLVGRGEHFRSAAPGAALYAADVYCEDPIGGSVEAVAAALAWLIGEQVPVVNISLVGPANRALALVVRRAAARGVLLVAAVGNDGPAAPPLYPAAYPDVVAVTAVDARGRVLPEACRGPHVAFAAPGADMAAAGVGDGPYTAPRGTSFAAPLVTGLLAASLHAGDAAAASLAVAALVRQAEDAGAPGRDVVYGHGIVARELRTDPAVVMR
jgi:subtilisin family serine protease